LKSRQYLTLPFSRRRGSASHASKTFGQNIDLFVSFTIALNITNLTLRITEKKHLVDPGEFKVSVVKKINPP